MRCGLGGPDRKMSPTEKTLVEGCSWLARVSILAQLNATSHRPVEPSLPFQTEELPSFQGAFRRLASSVLSNFRLDFGRAVPFIEIRLRFIAYVLDINYLVVTERYLQQDLNVPGSTLL